VKRIPVAQRQRACVLILAILAGCSSESVSSPDLPPRLRIVRTRDTTNALRQTIQLSAALVAHGSSTAVNDSLAWQSLAPRVMSVDANGRVTAQSTGTATIILTRGLLSDTAVLVSRQVLNRLIPTWTAETLFVDDSIALLAQGRDSNDFVMTLDDPLKVRSVSSPSASAIGAGLVRADRPGGAQVVMESAGVTATVSLFVDSVFTSVAAGSGFTCGLVSRGAVYCWGFRFDSGRPTTTRGLPSLVAIEAGVNHMCGLDSQGAAYCWESSSNARRISAPQPFVSVTAGYDFSCGLAADGSSYCWGWNQDGQLGAEPAGIGQVLANPVRTLAPPLQAVSAGSMQACGLSSGTILCWGQSFGTTPKRVGTSASFKSVTVGTGICGIRLDDMVTCFSGPGANVSPASPASQVAVGDGWVCALSFDRSAACWGENYYGQLGTDTRADTLISRPSPVVGGLQFRMITAGAGPAIPGKHSCGVDLAGRAFCWGDNSVGELGSPGSQTLVNYQLMLKPARVTRSRIH